MAPVPVEREPDRRHVVQLPGDNGLLTALALERRLDDEVSITVVDDFDQAMPRVGKSTLTSFVDFLHEILEIDHRRLVSEVPVGFKTSVYFEDWCGVEFHSPLERAIESIS